MGGQGNHTTKFNLQWQTSSFKSMPPLSLWKQGQESSSPTQTAGSSGEKLPCLQQQSKPGCRQEQHFPASATTLCFPQAHCTTRVQYNALHTQLSQSQSWASCSIINAPSCFSRTHSTDTKRKSQQKPKQNSQEPKWLKLYFTCCKLKTTAPTYLSSSSSLWDWDPC